MAKRYDVEERRLSRQRATAVEIGADMERQFIDSHPRLGGGEKRRVSAAVGVGFGPFDQRPYAVRSDRVQLDFDAGSGASDAGVENVRR
jgi:hypothetical protein